MKARITRIGIIAVFLLSIASKPAVAHTTSWQCNEQFKKCTVTSYVAAVGCLSFLTLSTGGVSCLVTSWAIVESVSCWWDYRILMCSGTDHSGGH